MIILNEKQSLILSILQSVAGAVERRHTLPILANVMIVKNKKNLQFTASDLEVQIRIVADLDGDDVSFSTTVNARKIIDILRSIPSEQVVSLEQIQNKFILKSGKSRFTLQTLPAEDFPLVQEASDFAEEFFVEQKTLKILLNQVSFSMATHDIRYYLNGILFVVDGNELTLVSTDGHRLAFSQAALKTKVSRQEVILPRKTVLELQRLLSDSENNIKVKFSGSQAKFSFESMEFVSKLVDGKFPDYNRVIPKNQKNVAIIDRLTFLSSLQRTAILTSEKFKGVRINIEPGLLRITSNNSEQEEAIDELKIEYSGDEIEVGFNVIYLIEALSNMEQEYIQMELSDANGSALVTIPDNNNFKYVVMPMRI